MQQPICFPSLSGTYQLIMLNKARKHEKNLLYAYIREVSYTCLITSGEAFSLAMKKENCITKEQFQTVLGAAMAALVESDITFKEQEVTVHPDHAVEATETVVQETLVEPEDLDYPVGDPAKWTPQQREQAWSAYLADNPEDADDAGE